MDAGTGGVLGLSLGLQVQSQIQGFVVAGFSGLFIHSRANTHTLA